MSLLALAERAAMVVLSTRTVPGYVYPERVDAAYKSKLVSTVITKTLRFKNAILDIALWARLI